MAIYTKGGDPDGMARAASNFRGYSRELGDIEGQASQALYSLDGSWSGNDFKSLRAKWPEAQTHMMTLRQTLTSMGDILDRNLQAQQQTSSVSGMSGGGALGFGGPGSPLAAAIIPMQIPIPDFTTGGGPLGWFLRKANLVPDGENGALMWPAWAGAFTTWGLSSASDILRKTAFGTWKPRGAGGLFIAKDMSRWQRGLSMMSDKNWAAHPYKGATSRGWGTAGKWAGRAGTVIAFATAAYSSWTKDSADPNMGTPEKATRAVTMGATTAAGGWAGAWAGAKGGALIGACIGGPVGAAIGGVVGGVVGGVIGGWAGEQIGNVLKEPLGNLASTIGGWFK